ncbi:hypothetical protein Golomagni_02312 [Golovinomyces magnicellulatus]|nr:hypothetical protein Golomagni_02312 [Golovinomyces magnicellulatus]
MPVKKVGISTAQKPIRLPPLNRLNVKRGGAGDKNPCLSIMSSVLTCWASNGFNVAGCQNLETQLRSCMDSSDSEEKHPQLSLSPNASKCGRSQKEINHGKSLK